MREHRLVLFPGMGADERMYGDLATQVGPIHVPAWLPPMGDLPHYAQNYVDRGLVRPGDWLGGSSFGGMLAQEIAALIPVRGLLLIGTCRCAREISLPLRHLAPLFRYLPLPRRSPAPTRQTQMVSWLLARKFGVTKPDHRHLLNAIVADADPRFIRWAGQIAGTWAGAVPTTTPTFQIHGRQDRLMPANSTQAETILPDAGHFIAVTHAQAVAAWLLRCQVTID
ncbi:MAG TPA: alpha/beta hydrolase [Planctomycetota bacterium]|nr:alpha/beta hydrolase [Planctomycetota bacterium]